MMEETISVVKQDMLQHEELVLVTKLRVDKGHGGKLYPHIVTATLNVPRPHPRDTTTTDNDST